MSYIRNVTSHISRGCNNLILITWGGGCNNVYLITWGVIWIFQNGGQNFCMRWSIKVFTITMSSFFFLISWNSRFPVRSVFIFNVSLFTSVICYCHNGWRRKHGKCSLCNEWWHCWLHRSNKKQKHKKENWVQSEINQELLPFIHNISISHNINIASYPTLSYGFWKRSALTNVKKDALKYMMNRLWYGIFHITCHINPRPI